MRSLWIIVGVVVVVIVTIFVSIRLSQKSAPQEQVIKIGAILPLTGELSLFGQWLKEGINLAALESKVIIIFEDNKNRTTESVSAFYKLITTDKVQGIITARTPVAFALAPLAARTQIPVVFTFADLPEKIEGCVLNYHFPVKDEVKFLANTMTNIGDKAIVLTVNDDFGRTSAMTFKANYKGKVIFEDTFDARQIDFRSIIAKLPRNADFIFLVAYEQNFVSLVKHLNEQKISIPIVGPNTLTVFLPLAKKFLTMPIYVIMSTYDAGLISSDNKLYQRFKEKFRKQYNKEPNMVNAEAYEATKYLIDLLQKHDMSSAEVCKYIASPRTIPSLFGILKVSPDGQVHFPLAVVKLEGEKRNIIATWQP